MLRCYSAFCGDIVKIFSRSIQEGETYSGSVTPHGPFVPFAFNHRRDFPGFVYLSFEGGEWFGDKGAFKIYQRCQGRNIKQYFEYLQGTVQTIKLMEQLLMTEGQGFQGFGKLFNYLLGLVLLLLLLEIQTLTVQQLKVVNIFMKKPEHWWYIYIYIHILNIGGNIQQDGAINHLMVTQKIMPSPSRPPGSPFRASTSISVFPSAKNMHQFFKKVEQRSLFLEHEM